MPNTITLVNKDGQAFDVPADQAAGLLGQGGYTVETPEMKAGRLSGEAKQAAYGGVTGDIAAAAAGGLRTVTGGLSDVGLDLIGAGHSARAIRDVNPTASVVGEIAGGALPIGATGLASRLGAKVAGKGAGIARSVAGGIVEGGVQGVGQGVSELALSDQPIDAERIASTIGYSALTGGLAGGGINLAGKVVEKGLIRAKSALDDFASKGVSTGADVAGDLAGLDKQGLKVAERAELDAIEAARVPRRAELADEIKAFRRDLKENKLWLATKGAEEREVREIGKITLDADRGLDRILRDPKALAESPQAALKQLRVQEDALNNLVTKHGDDLRVKFAADTSGDRVKALDYASTALERNRELQAKIAEVAAKPASQRLTQIANATEALNAPKQTAGFGIGEALGQSALGHMLGAATGMPLVGEAVFAAKMAGSLVKKLGLGSAENAARASKAVQTFLDVGRKVAPTARPLATKTLTSVAFAPSRERADAPAPKHTLASAFKARSEEIRSLVQPMPDGSVQMRPAAREKMAENLTPIAAMSPMLADRIETTKARGIEFLASKLPRKPDLGGIPIGPDNWQPSDMEMRTWARYVAAVEDPHGVIERLADGSVSPEDAEAIREVYPELHSDIARQIFEQLPSLRQKLPYQRRLALSLFTGIPVDPSFDPRVITALQATYAEEAVKDDQPGPMPKPAFGSVKAQDATPAQERAG